MGCEVWGVGCGVKGSGCGVQGVGCGVWGVGCRVQGVGCGVTLNPLDSGPGGWGADPALEDVRKSLDSR